MKYQISGKQIDIGDALKAHAEEQLLREARLEERAISHACNGSLGYKISLRCISSEVLLFLSFRRGPELHLTLSPKIVVNFGLV